MEFVVSALATYGICILLTESDGPGDLFARLRALKGLSVVLTCVPCLAVWVGALVALYTAHGPLDWIVTMLALAGAAIFINKVAL